MNLPKWKSSHAKNEHFQISLIEFLKSPPPPPKTRTTQQTEKMSIHIVSTRIADPFLGGTFTRINNKIHSFCSLILHKLYSFRFDVSFPGQSSSYNARMFATSTSLHQLVPLSSTRCVYVWELMYVIPSLTYTHTFLFLCNRWFINETFWCWWNIHCITPPQSTSLPPSTNPQFVRKSTVSQTIRSVELESDSGSLRITNEKWNK